MKKIFLNHKANIHKQRNGCNGENRTASFVVRKDLFPQIKISREKKRAKSKKDL